MFRTELSGFETKSEITLQDKILSAGSCFANDIGQVLKGFKFDIQINPCGILFNPLSIFEIMEMSLDGQDFPEQAYVKSQGRYLNYKLHSEINGRTLKEIGSKSAVTQVILNHDLKERNLMVLTFGTAWVYRLKQSGMLVANCHKVPQSEFSKELISVSEITEAFKRLRMKIHEVNPTMRFLLTVSPVRHLKDSIPLNAVSKSVLRLACHELEETIEGVSYFPSYELMMDDLRDYRFYKSDMIHPNEQALEYIWQKFVTHCFDKSTQTFIRDWTGILSALAHKPFHPESGAHQAFLRNTIQKVENFSSKVDVSEELALLRAQLTQP